MSNKNVVNEFFSPDLLGRMHNIDIVLESKLCVNQKVFLHNLRTISKKRRIENAKMIVTRLTYQNLRLIANFAFCIISLSKLQLTNWIRRSSYHHYIDDVFLFFSSALFHIIIMFKIYKIHEWYKKIKLLNILRYH